jgi:hypothetical protein
MRSPDGRLQLTDDELVVEGRHYSLLELERVSVRRVRWLLWLLLGGLTLAWFVLAFLQNWLRTPTAMLGMTAGALLLAWGQRGTNRLRLYRLGREAAHHALPGDLAEWQKLTAEANQRIHLRHQRSAIEALVLLHTTAPAADDSSATADLDAPAAL